MQTESTAPALDLAVYLEKDRRGRFVITFEPADEDLRRLHAAAKAQAVGDDFKEHVRQAVLGPSEKFFKVQRELALMEKNIRTQELDRERLEIEGQRARIELSGEALMAKLVELERQDADLAARLETNRRGVELPKSEVEEGLQSVLRDARYAGRQFVEALPPVDQMQKELCLLLRDAIAAPLAEFIQQEFAREYGNQSYEMFAEGVVKRLLAK